jgi:hypothetical protein
MLRIRILIGIALLAHVPSLVRAAPAIPTSTVTSNFFFTVHSNASSMIWIAPPTWKVTRDTAPPIARGSAITLHAARNEYEPVQVAVRSTTAGTRTLSLGNWAGPSAMVPVATLHDVSYGATPCAAGRSSGALGELTSSSRARNTDEGGKAR